MNILERDKLESDSGIRTESGEEIAAPPPGVNQICARVRAMAGAVLLASAVATAAEAQEKPKDIPDTYRLNGSVSSSVQYLTTTYRKGHVFNVRLNAPKLGPIVPSADLSVSGLNACFVPGVQVNMGANLDLASRPDGEPAYLAVNPSVNTGLAYYMTGLDQEKTTDYIPVPYASANLGLPIALSLDDKKSNYFSIIPSVSYKRLLRTTDLPLKIFDSDGDGTPDQMIPRHQFALGIAAGLLFDNKKTYLGANLNYDPLDPWMKKSGGVSLFGNLTISRNF
jgi:hypothetical protein